MRFTSQTATGLSLLLSIFIINPLQEAAYRTCLAPEWWGSTLCTDIGMKYIDYPTTTEALNEFRNNLLDPSVVIWFQAGSEDWFKLISVTTIHRNSSLGTVFDGKRSPGRDDGGDESFHVCLKTPCTLRSSKTTNHRNPVHLSKIAYSTDGGVAPQGTNYPVDDPQVISPNYVPPANVPGPVKGARYKVWKVVASVSVLALGAGNKIASSFPQLSARQMMTEFFRGLWSFILNNCFAVIWSAECGFIEGLSDSLWTSAPGWFRGVLRLMCYATLALHFGLLQWGYCKVMTFGARFPWGKMRNFCRRSKPKPLVTPPPPPITGGAPNGSEPPSDREDAGCMAHVVYMDLELKKLAVSQTPCREVNVDDVPIVYEDWVASKLPIYCQNEVSLCAVHASMYHTLRGANMCFRKGCTYLGSMGPDGHHYCTKHIAQAVLPSAPPPQVKFVGDKDKSSGGVAKQGVCLVPDEVLVPLIEKLRQGGCFANQPDLIDELTERYGGDVFENAMHVRQLEAESERLAKEFEDRLRKIDLISEEPRIVPSPHQTISGSIPVPQVDSKLTGKDITPPPPPPPPVVVQGRMVPPVLAAPAPSYLFTSPNTQSPIPGVVASSGGPLSDNALLTSMVYHIDRIANPDVNPKPGTLDGIRRNDEIHIFVARFFDNYTVTLCPGVVGKQLALGLKSLNERLRPLYELHKIPTGFSNRLCLGAACLTWGGRGKDEDWVLNESDFPSWTPSDFDKYNAPNGWNLENRARASQHIETWRVNALNMSRMFSAVYGLEWYDERALAVETLRSMHIEAPHKFTLAFIKEAWGTLNHRWTQEIKETTNLIRLHAKVERPTFEQIKMIGLTVIQSTGLTVFQRPKAFDLVDPGGYFVAEIVRKMVDDKELSSWANYHSHTSGRRELPNNRVGGSEVEPMASLPGPPMTAAERRIAANTAPKSADGRKLCWGYNTHMGCTDNECTRAHEYVKNYEQLSTAVKISLVKRLGFRKHNKLSVNKVGDAIRDLRKIEAEARSSQRNPPAARGDATPNANPTMRVAGVRVENPPQLSNIDYWDSEEVLRGALHGSAQVFGEGLPQGEDVKAGITKYDQPNDSKDPKLTETIQIRAAMEGDPKLKFLEDTTPHLSSFVKARVLQSLRDKKNSVEQSIQAALECACTLGLPSLREEALKVLDKPDRVGATSKNFNPCGMVSFGSPRLVDKLTVTPMCIDLLEFLLYDFGDTIPLLPKDPVFDLYGKSLEEKNKCLIIHMAASLLSLRSGRVTENGILGRNLSEVHQLASELRLDQFKQARECLDCLGDHPPSGSVMEAELKSHAHDIVSPNHDRGYKSLICFPPRG